MDCSGTTGKFALLACTFVAAPGLRAQEVITPQPTQTQAAQSSGSSEIGQPARSAIGTVGRRQGADVTGQIVPPIARIGNRISNRIQNRIRNRIDQNYDAQADATSQIENAETRTRNASPRS